MRITETGLLAWVRKNTPRNERLRWNNKSTRGMDRRNKTLSVESLSSFKCTPLEGRGSGSEGKLIGAFRSVYCHS